MNRWIFVLFVLCFTGLAAQQSRQQKPLIELLPILEERYNITFSYKVDDIAGELVAQPSPELEISELIDFLNSNSSLYFQLLENGFITISRNNSKPADICAVVIDNLGQPLLGANVIVQNTSTGAITDIDGAFNLMNVPSNAIVQISFLGFRRKMISASELTNESGECPTITLDEGFEELNQVVLTKFLTTGLQTKLDGSVVLNTEEFGILPGLTEPDVLQSIQALPGVESINESIANINVRGGTHDQNLILWDGIKMYHSGHFFGLISAYNPNLTNKVVVTKNGTPAEFSDGVSSTINMFTHDEIENKVKGGAGVNLLSGDAFLRVPVGKKFSLHLSGRRSLSDAFGSPTFDQYFERSFQDSEIQTTDADPSTSSIDSNFKFYDATAKLLWDLNDNHKFRANVIFINNDLDYNESRLNSNDQTERKESSLIQENLGAAFHWRANWNNFDTEAVAYFSSYTVDANDYRVNTDQRLTQSNEVLESGFKFKAVKPLSQNLNVTVGYQLNETGILNETTVSNPSYERTKKDVLINHSLFTEAEYKKGGTYLRAGVRGQYFQKFSKALIEPRLVFRQRLVRDLDFKLEGEMKNQSAIQIVDFQDDFLGVENRRWILANEQDIPISTSHQVSGGFEFHPNNWSVGITGFYKDVEGITASNQGFYNNFQYVNASGSYEVKGVEFLINKTAAKYSLWAGYTTSINDYNFEDLSPSNFPNNVDIRHSVSLAFNIDVLPNLSLAMGGIWRTGQPFTKPLEGNETVQNGSVVLVNYDEPNAERLDEFKRLDASLVYEFKFSPEIKAILRAGVINITNEDNVINRYYEVNPEDDQRTIQVDNLSLGITPNVSCRIQF